MGNVFKARCVHCEGPSPTSLLFSPVAVYSAEDDFGRFLCDKCQRTENATGARYSETGFTRFPVKAWFSWMRGGIVPEAQ